MITVTGQQWQRRAVCFLETPDAPELWTPDRKPRHETRVHLEQMCQRCPVRRRCATEAVAGAAETGMYAGVWVPQRCERKAWDAAMERLELIAGSTPTHGDEALGGVGMIADKAPVMRRPRPVGFATVASAARLQLCTVSRDDDSVRARHVAALLAFTPTVVRAGNRMRITFADGPTTMWVYEVLANADVELVDVGKDGGVLVVTNPQMVLGRYGFRDGRWVFGQGRDAALGISRGAVHAAGSFNKHGLKVACPSTPMMLTLTAVMTRLGITARPTEGEPRAAISAGDVPVALDRLGIAGIADEYQRLRDTNVVRKDA